MIDNYTEIVFVDNLLQRSPLVATTDKIIPLAGDASGRRYFRVLLNSATTQSAILLLPGSLKGPVVYSQREIIPNDVFLQLPQFLNDYGYRLPQIYAISSDKNVFLIEDVGDQALWHFAFNKLSPSEQIIAEELGEDYTCTLFKRAIDQICTLQDIPRTQEILAFQRSLQFEQYRAETQRFIDHYLLANNYSKSIISAVEKALDALCEIVSDHPTTLVHRDFMAWNIHVLPDGSLAIIDYQDMLIASHAYDIVSLIHDRDIDNTLGDNLCAELAKYFFTKTGLPSNHYHEIILQRYLRLAGQFHLLTHKFNKPIYSSWVPGCLKRVGRSLPLLPDFANLADVLSCIPEVAQGLDHPWDF